MIISLEKPQVEALRKRSFKITAIRPTGF